MKQGTANLAEDYCFIHKALRPVSKARRKIAAVPPSNSRPVLAIMDKNVVEIGDPPVKYKSTVWKFFGFPKYKEGLQNETSERSTSYRRTRLIHSTHSLVYPLRKSVFANTYLYSPPCIRDTNRIRHLVYSFQP